MKTIGRPLVAVAAALTLAVTGCGGRHRQPPGAEPNPAPPAATATATPAPTPTTTTPPAAPTVARVVSAQVTYPWRWPGDRGGPITHTYPVPPLPHLIRIGAGDHPREPGERPYNRMSFTFDTTFPSYWFQYTDKLISDARGEVIPLGGRAVLRIVFMQAQAHVSNGTASSIISQPARDLGLRRMVDYAQAGDFEGVVTYGIGIDWPTARSNPQIPVRVYEVHRITAAGQHEYVVAFDVDAR